MTEIPVAPVKRIIKNTGAVRVSEDAAETLRICLEEIALEIGEKANKLACHAGRKTITSADIKLAIDE